MSRKNNKFVYENFSVEKQYKIRPKIIEKKEDE